MSIMFVDVRGFTSFAERSDATEVVAALNALFEVMVPIVAEHGGHVDKFLGDGLLAVFGAPEGYRRPRRPRGRRGARARRGRSTGPGPSCAIGVGINTGPVVAGSIGGAGRLNFSVIGDAVNLAARVEAATRDTGDDLLITRATRDALTPPGRRDVARHGRAQGQGGAGRGAGLPGRRGGGGGGAGHVAGRRRRTPAG